MRRRQRQFTREFRNEAASLVVDQGYTIAKAAEAVDVSMSAMGRWATQLKLEREGLSPTSNAITAEQQKIQELQQQVRRLEREKSILKKATALLISDEIDPTR
jgi:transposase